MTNIDQYLNRIIHTDALSGLRMLPDNIVQCIVTSPPYWALRDYKLPPLPWPEVTFSILGFEVTVEAWEGCLGLEPTPMMFIGHLVLIFREARRTLRDDGTLWLNIGDSYVSSGKNRTPDQAAAKTTITGGISTQLESLKQQSKIVPGLKRKDIVGIPWMLAYALRSAGWYLRQDLIWHKPNPMPESVSDRCTKSHEYIFLFSKAEKYYYDAFSIATPYAEKTSTTFGSAKTGYGDGSGLIASENWSKSVPVRKPKDWNNNKYAWGRAIDGSVNDNRKGSGEELRKAAKTEKKNLQRSDKNHSMHEARDYGLNGKGFQGHNGYYDKDGNVIGNGKANKRSVWTVPTKSFPEAHFATFPDELIVDCIKAGSPIESIVLDMFMGSGTTAEVAAKLNRNFIGFELNSDYIKIAERRLHKSLGMFNPIRK